MGLNLITFEECIFQDMKTYLPKHLLVKNDAIVKSDERRKIRFVNCEFDTFSIGNITDNQDKQNVKLCEFHFFGGKIKNLLIQNIEIASKFYINKQDDKNKEPTKIEQLTIKNSIFKENFKLYHCEIDRFIIKDTDFEKQADFSQSVFKKGFNSNTEDNTIKFKALNFKGLALFGDCEFHQKVNFQYVTFEDNCHFKRSDFNKGLNLDDANIQKEINFLDIKGLDSKISMKYTSKETYRIIKYNFQKIGNQIEANKYHVLELQAQKKTLSFKKFKDYPNLVIYWVHYLTSNFSSNWLLVLPWIGIVALIVSCSLPNIVLYDPLKLDCFSKFQVKFISILADIDLDEHPYLFIFHKASLAYLYYQFISAIRRDVKK